MNYSCVRIRKNCKTLQIQELFSALFDGKFEKFMKIWALFLEVINSINSPVLIKIISLLLETCHVHTFALSHFLWLQRFIMKEASFIRLNFSSVQNYINYSVMSEAFYVYVRWGAFCEYFFVVVEWKSLKRFFFAKIEMKSVGI